ncbi:putative ABC transporter, ATP-binding component [Gordonia polyisoprenivorans VH2]|uniref:Trehalose import ATP-binding protein SugC n=1 Tax=Gordonia polyisoprenivorans (strain DSM 44266 / VH2) TaxID=1112204 RepID=H6N3Y7_GORPV|nr:MULTISPECIES: ABC transporter ATP-binding protein [Gordonia]AFA74810.1 putative ABC transporter, ATP-binding component [Gordonia polyisoprenivorans VH2]MDF3284436.1 ABC transporter ATP-binding protein [Gordonia sp. N1V]OPX16539.1 ABC transporter ATP-binding protein [Gordonia sp. i37]
MSRIELDSLTKAFGNSRALESVDLTIGDGEFIVFLGPSGCGKSTLLRTIAGLSEPTSGSVRIDGRDVTGTSPRERNLAMVFQSYALYPHLSVAKNIGFPLRTRRLRRSDIAAQVADAAESLQLTPLLNRRPADLSGGQRQRVALARAMVQKPGAYLMDEPLSNLDAQLRSATRGELIDLHRRMGATFLYVTHDQVEAMTMATRIVLLNAGRVEQVGTPTELYDRPESSFVAAFLGAPPMCLFDAVAGGRNGRVVVAAGGLTVPLELPAPTDYSAQPVTAGIRPERIRLIAAAAPRPTDAIEVGARVGTIENLGSDEVVHLRVGSTALQARVARPCGVREGDSVRLAIAPQDVHLFDRVSGRRLHWDPTPCPPPTRTSDLTEPATPFVSQGALS